MVAPLAGGMAVGPAVAAAWLPALAAGSVLWAAGRRRDWPRRRLAWALAGAATALICYFRLYPEGSAHPPYSGLFPLRPAMLAAAFILTGAAAGQVFRSTLAATAPFFGFGGDGEDEGAP